MSKIQAEIVEATDLSTKRGEDRQAFLERVLRAVNELSDPDFAGLSVAAKEWANKAADAKNSKAKSLPDFPDQPAAEEPPPARRRATQEEPEQPEEQKQAEIKEKDVREGMCLRVLTSRGKDVSGHVVEIDADKGLLVLKLGNGDEQEFDLDRITKMFTLPDPKKSAPLAPGVGDEVKVKTKRGKEYVGDVLELSKSDIVILTDAGEEEFSLDRVESIEVIKAAQSQAAKPAAASSAKSAAPSGAEDKKNTRVSNEGVSIGSRIKELIAENMDASPEEIAKLLKKDGLDFKENTLKLNYSDMHKTLDILRARKLLKA